MNGTLLKKFAPKQAPIEDLDVSANYTEQDLRNLIYITDSEDDTADEEAEKNNNLKCEVKISSTTSSQSTTSLNTKEKLKQIANENEILAKKLLAKVPKKKLSDTGLTKVSSSSAVNRKKAQWNIDRTNQVSILCASSGKHMRVKTTANNFFLIITDSLQKNTICQTIRPQCSQRRFVRP